MQRSSFIKRLSIYLGSAGLAGLPATGSARPPSGGEQEPAVETETFYLWDDQSENNGSNPEYRPKITLYRPNLPGRPEAPRPAMLVCPGGGYHVQAPHEGEPFARLFAMHGIVSAVLTYRVHPDRFPAPYADACRAMRILRERADDFGIDPDRIGIMGFSAGGHLASTVATQPDLYSDPEDDLAGRHSARPQRVVLGYPVISFREFTHEGSRRALLGENPDPGMLDRLSNDRQVRSDAPSAFLFHTADDPGVPVQNSMLYADACLRHGVPVDLHVFSHGRHGVGMALDDEKLKIWSRNLIAWLGDWTVEA